jgi:excisionase family DNA binding protein
MGETMSTEQAAMALGLSVSQVRRLARDGVLVSQRLSARVLIYDSDDVARYQRERHKPGWPKGKPRKPAVPEQSQ